MDNINRVYSKVFAWLFVGLLITFGTGYGLYLNKDLMITTLKTMYIPIIIIELAIACERGVKPDMVLKKRVVLKDISCGVAQ